MEASDRSGNPPLDKPSLEQGDFSLEGQGADWNPGSGDIPEAFRETPTPQPQSLWSRQKLVIGGVAGLGAIAILVGSWAVWRSQAQPPEVAQGQNTSGITPDAANGSAQPDGTSTGANNTLLGHHAYEEAPAKELAPIVADGRIKLRRAAAEKYKQMAADAQANGITLAPISGFRSLDDQKYLFFEVKAERGQSATKRAEVSAPPGYSEHHTGYAVDIGDADVPATNLSPNFENTAAFQWLQENAAYYSFELSFPKNNPQGVTYEPWHWRFVGDRHSLETFYKARQKQ